MSGMTLPEPVNPLNDMLPEFWEIFHVYITIGENKKLGEGKLPFP